MSIIKRLKARLVRSGLTVCAAVVAVIGVGFLVAAAYIALGRVLTPLLTAVVFGVGWLLLALIVWLLGRLWGGRRRREKARLPPEEDLAAVLGVLLGSETRDWMRENGDKATVAALVAGAVLGASPPLQRLVSKLARAAAAGARQPRR